MKKIFLLTLLLAGLLAPLAFAQQSLTLSTYYPAPYGAYDRLRLVPQDTIVGTDCDIGTLYIETPAGLDESNLKFCRNDGTGTGQWAPLVGVWTKNGNDIYPADTLAQPGLNVGIGTDTPASKLHVSGGTGTAQVLIEAGAGGTAGITLSADADTAIGQLLLTTANGILQTTTATDLHLGTQATSRLTITSGGNVGVRDETPDALFEISGDGLNEYFMISKDDGTDGDIMKIDAAGKVYINNPATVTTGRVNIRGEGADNGEIGFGADGGEVYGTYDLVYDGGADKIARFANKGLSADYLEFDFFRTSLNDLFELARLYNHGLFWVKKRLVIGKELDAAYESTTLHVHEPDPAKDLTVVFADKDTATNFTDPDQPYINTDTIGTITPFKRLDSAASTSTLGGMMITGFSDGDAGQAVPGLSLAGAIGSTNAFTMPAVNIEGFKLDASNNIVRLTGTDTVFSANYFNPAPAKSTFKILANGKVGIGLAAADAPAATLDVSGAMLLEPLDTAPASCADGSLYVDKTGTGALCFCFGGSWSVAAGTGSCL